MARRNQPYLPLYVQDFLTDEKLNECSPMAVGIYIKLMCVMHKSETYGKILLKQKYKQKNNFAWCFACQLVRQLTFDLDDIEKGLTELLSENVLQVEQGDDTFLVQKRMVRDADLSDARSKAGSKGGICSSKKKEFAQAKSQANSENEIENENEIESIYDFTLILDLLRSELPEIDLTNAIVSNVAWVTIDTFITDMPEFREIGRWKDYISRIKKSDWLMRRTEKGSPLSLKFICKPDTVLQTYSGAYDNHTYKKTEADRLAEKHAGILAWAKKGEAANAQ